MKRVRYLSMILLFLVSWNLAGSFAVDSIVSEKNALKSDRKVAESFSAEDESGKQTKTTATTAAVAGAVAVVGIAGYFLLRKKK